MANFWIGQRVKCVADFDNELNLIGKAGVVTNGWRQYIVRAAYRAVLREGWEVKFDGVHGFVICSPGEIEPILPDGLESPDLIDELYEPDPVELLEEIK